MEGAGGPRRATPLAKEKRGTVRRAGERRRVLCGSRSQVSERGQGRTMPADTGWPGRPLSAHRRASRRHDEA